MLLAEVTMAPRALSPSVSSHLSGARARSVELLPEPQSAADFNALRFSRNSLNRPTPCSKSRMSATLYLSNM